MTRRDTIIISVLINAGLLAILFATAWNSDDDSLSEGANVRVAMNEPVPNQVASSVGVDEVDRVLEQHAVIPSAERTVTVAPQPTYTAAKKTQTSGSFVEVTVKRGDSLDKLARDNNTSVEAIAKANDLVDTRLQIGQVLRLPTGAAASSMATTPQKTASYTPEFYTVQSGDSPWVIAKKLSVDLQDLLRINDLDEAKARRLRAGDKLKIPRLDGAVASR